MNRLFEIVYLLLDKKLLTAKQLSEHFEVSQRTIYRDVEIICQAGIPLYTTKGKGGGIQLLDHYVLNKTVLSEQEQREIMSALHGLYALQYPDNDQVLTKLNSLFGSREHEWIEVDLSDWSDARKETFLMLKDAILHKKAVTFDYYGSYGEKSFRVVEPLKLWFKQKAWYIKGYCRDRQEQRTFKISRIDQLQVLEEQFEREFVKDSSSKQSESMNRPIVTLHLKIAASQAYRVVDEFEQQYVVQQEDGSFIVTVSYPYDEWVYGYILSFGSHVEVLEPVSVRVEIAKRLQSALNHYS